MADEHIHTWDDRRGVRRVFLDGKELTDGVRMADTKLGIVEVISRPIRINPETKELAVERLTGVVTVEFMGSQ